MSLAFIDCETTGTDPERHHVWEIGLITASGEYSWILQLTDEELATAEPMALSIGNYYERAGKAYQEYAQDMRFAPANIVMEDSSLQKAMRDHPYIAIGDRSTLADFLAREISRSHLVGAVPSFDARFVGDLMRNHSRPPSWHYHLVDVEALAAGKLGLQPPWKSKALYRALGIEPIYFDQHTALGDARMAKAVYEKVFGLRPTWPEADMDIEEEKEEVNQSAETQT